SVDGIEWVELSTVISNRTWTGGVNTWLKSGKKFFYDSVAKQSDPNALNTDGWEIASGIAPETTLDAGIDNLSVATNATVTANKTVTTRRITIDVSGMGAASGFALAEGGVIDIVNAPETGDFEVDADLSGISLPSIYSLLVNGDAINKKLIVSPDDRKIAVRGYGFIMTLR
ncbi:MAG: hypothetical protein IKK82_02025, partial [Kiritimatiellae bacterium]|nr:hypothetical protein [Kiritimatiellia bacterium]